MGDAFVVVFLKPEIATGTFRFASTTDADDDQDVDTTTPTPPPSSIPGVSAVEAAFLLPNGHFLPVIFAKIQEKGFEIVQQRVKQFTRAEARQLFSHEAKRFEDDDRNFADFLKAMTNGPTLVLLLKLPAAIASGDSNAGIKLFDDIAGHWDPVVVRQKALADSVPHDQWQLRALCGLNAIQNGIFCSAHSSSVHRERFTLFPPSTPRLERAVVVLLPKFHGRKEALLSALGMGVRAVVVATAEACILSIDEILSLCGFSNPGPAQQVCDGIVQLWKDVVGDKGVDVVVVEGLDLNYTLRITLGPANVEYARLYFPESVRAQVPDKLPSVELPAGVFPNATTDEALGFESGLFVSFGPKLSVRNVSRSDSNGQPIEFTLALIKPNAACRSDTVQEILHMINLFGFTVERQRRLRLSRDQAGEFYAEHCGKIFFETLLNFMTSGEIMALQLSRPHAIRAWRGLMGPTNSIKARETHPWTLRARFGEDGTRNATHGSDSESSAARELCFFFGSAVSPSSITNSLLDKRNVKARAVAQQKFGVSQSSVEEVLSTGLQELIEKKLADPLDACRWLGEWLLTYRSRGLNEDPAMLERSQERPKATLAKKKVEEEVKQEVRQVVAITLDTKVDNSLRTAIFRVLCERLAQYKLINVSDELKKHTSLQEVISELVKQLTESGCRRCVLFDCEELTSTSVFHRDFRVTAPADWHINFAVHLGSTSANTVMPTLHLNLQSSKKPETVLQDLFYSVFDPNVVLVADSQLLVPVATWTAVAERFGFRLLTFDSFVAVLKATNDESGETRQFLELTRSGSNVPPTLLLKLLRRVVISSNTSLSQKILLLGFPWTSIPPSELETTIVRPTSVLFVSRSSSSDSPAWLAPYWKLGLVKRIPVDTASDHAKVCGEMNGSLAPMVGCLIGECTDDDQLGTVQAAAKAQEFIWLDCSSRTRQELSELLFRSSFRQKFLLYNYPRTPAQAKELINIITMPQFVLYSSVPCSSATQEMLAVFNEHPTIMEFDLASFKSDDSSYGISKLRSTFLCKQIVVAVGSVGVLDLPQLREVVDPLGFAVISFQQYAAWQQQDGFAEEECEQLRAFERCVRAVQTPRCLIVGAPESTTFYQTLEARVGCAINKIIILQSVPVRVRAPDDGELDEYSDDDDDGGNTDENDSDGGETSLFMRSGVKPQKVMKAFSPQLSQLLQTFASSSTSSISIDVLGFLETAAQGDARILQDVVARLRPRLVGVVGNRLSFYQAAARRSCSRHLVGFVNLAQASSSLQALEQLAKLASSSPHVAYCVDGFPSASLPGDSAPAGSISPPPPRYVAQQLWELSRRVGSFVTLIHFTTSLVVLAERVTRRALDEAQDDLELASNDLLAWFATGKSRHGATSEVVCDRTVEDAQDEMDNVLLQTLQPRRPTLNKKTP